MGSLFSGGATPKAPPPPPPPPKEDDVAVQTAAAEAARRRKMGRGYRATILGSMTGAQGDLKETLGS